MNIQLVIECLGFRTALAMTVIAVIKCASDRTPMSQWPRIILTAFVAALSANMMRIQLLYWIGSEAPHLFNLAHDWLGYGAMLLALGTWFCLIDRQRKEK